MFQPNKYITDTILPQEDLEIRSGKKMFGENAHEFMDRVKNAGVHGQRISELNLNSRKKIAGVKSDSSQMREALNHYDIEPIEISPKKKPLTYYSGYDNQEKYFETKLVPDHQGKMSICVGRKAGSATINMSLEDYDLEKTYHTWKRIMDRDAPHTRSNLENDRFLTVNVNALRSDKLPEVKNRNPPVANPDGPFEEDGTNQPIYKRGNLDRTLTPKETSQRLDAFRKVQSNYTPTSHIFQGNTEGNSYKGYGIGEEALVVKGVRRTNFPWIETDRLKNIIQNKCDDDFEEERNYKITNSRSTHSLSNQNKKEETNQRNPNAAALEYAPPQEEQQSLSHINHHHHHHHHNNNNMNHYMDNDYTNYTNYQESQRMNEDSSNQTNESYNHQHQNKNVEYEPYNNHMEYEPSSNHQNTNQYEYDNCKNYREKPCCNFDSYEHSYENESVNTKNKMSNSHQSYKVPSVTNIYE